MPRHEEIYQRLKDDHENIRAMLKSMAQTGAGDTEQRRDLMDKFKKELLAHSHAEEHAFYEPLEKHRLSRASALEGETEHGVMENLLQELDRTDPADDHWHARFKVLKEILEHHLEEEETSTFPKAREVLSEPEAVSIAERFDKEKEQLKHQL